jgi:hypothetical protein
VTNQTLKSEAPRTKTIDAASIKKAFVFDDWREKKRINLYGRSAVSELRKRITLSMN